ncbi:MULTISPECIES: hypothetical protein [Streptosporangium]|uniref:Serine/threonine protein kinase n=1 Tax=Streptosporangium brasiliense TaxID=47480 RepID=A0ABT9R9G3_9ACTN|nr:hypothetical protein [Streptosporangium brasiliense]MDP9865444.1 hypothetical protein [Streptosporangium brasiliense]
MRTPHTPVWAGAVRATVVTGALCLGLPAVAQPSHAARLDSEQVAVINGDFALPAFAGTGPDWAAVQGWSVGSTYGSGTAYGVGRYSGAAAGHPSGKAAVMLRFPTAATYSFKQRLRGVRAGAQVTVTFDDSPGVATACTPASVASGQSYTVEGSGGQVDNRTTAPDPDKKANTLGKGVWRTGQTYTFTAGEHEPLLTFTSQVPAADNANGYCGPMIAAVRAVQVPPPVDKSIPKTALPASQAFYGNDRRTVAEAVNHCAGAPNRCAFTPEEAYSYAYYEPAKVNSDTYINCTRNALTRNRPVTFAGRSYGDLPANAGLPGGVAGTPVSNMSQQFTAGTGTSPSWSTAITHNVTEIVQPSEASWIETQAGRRRTEGWFTSTPAPADPHTEWRLYTVLDYSSVELSDRVYQRTGPMTASEKQRCQSDRPSATTPVGAGAPAGGERTP